MKKIPMARAITDQRWGENALLRLRGSMVEGIAVGQCVVIVSLFKF